MERNEPVIVEQLFNKSIIEVWSAITEAEQMRQWFFENIPAFEAKEGFEISFNVQANGRDYLHLWKITEVIPQKKRLLTVGSTEIMMEKVLLSLN